eukprot:scaffold349801_cov17-Prasinocladus_malaysianus.AAC.1
MALPGICTMPARPFEKTGARANDFVRKKSFPWPLAKPTPNTLPTSIMTILQVMLCTYNNEMTGSVGRYPTWKGR